MVTITSLLDRVRSVSAPIIPEFLDKHTNASVLGTVPVITTGAEAFSTCQEEPMQELTHEEEMQVNRALSREFIRQNLDIKVTDENIEALAQFIFKLEQKDKVTTSF